MRVWAVLGLLAAAAAPAPPAGPVAISAAIPAGPLQEAAKRLLLKPYADATATTLGQPAWDGAMASLAATGADLALLDAPSLAAACAKGTVVRLDWNRLGRDRFLGPAVSDCGMGVGLEATALAWDAGRIHDAPNWSDFWDVAKHPGRRGLPPRARGTLEIALLADGVPSGDVYRTLRTSEGVDRAFRKLDQLKPYVEWWSKPSEPAQFLAAGRVLMIAAPASGLVLADRTGRKPHHFAVNWSGGLIEPVSLAVLQKAPHAAAAAAALVIASDLARQAQFAEATGLGPANKDALPLLPAEVRAMTPTLAGALVVDEGFWAENGAKLEARFQAWLGK